MATSVEHVELKVNSRSALPLEHRLKLAFEAPTIYIDR